MTDIEPIFVRLAPVDIALAKFLFESYEDIGIVRTLDKREAVIVVLAVRDFVPDAWAAVHALRRMVPCEVVEAPPEATGDWLLEALVDEEAGA